jgi:nucleoside-diphosphate-sugar epimerase
MTLGKVILAGGGGLVGQNLVYSLKEAGASKIVVLDKNAANAALLQQMHPDIDVVIDDLAVPGQWSTAFDGAQSLVMLQAQIGGLIEDEFVRNNITSTENILAACRTHGISYICHISSSVVNSMAVDFYTETKKKQEHVIENCGISHVTLRPTLMFGWYDRKHLGWLARFMRRVPVFPIPGLGRYLRQPLFVLDFCAIIVSCLRNRTTGTYNITGQEKIFYGDIVAQIKKTLALRTLVLPIPYSFFWFLLWLFAKFNKNPPFTVSQLKALATPDEFEVINWPDIFGVRPTPLAEAFQKTWLQKPHCDVVLTF